MASGSRTLVGKILAVAAALMLIASALVYFRVVPVEPPLQQMLGVVLAGIGVVDTLMAVYFILSDPS